MEPNSEALQKGTKVVVIDGPHKGKSGILDEVYRALENDPDRPGYKKITIRRCMIEVEGGFIQTRLEWIREEK